MPCASDDSGLFTSNTPGAHRAGITSEAMIFPENWQDKLKYGSNLYYLAVMIGSLDELQQVLDVATLSRRKPLALSEAKDYYTLIVG